jgi:hypothetical protein
LKLFEEVSGKTTSRAEGEFIEALVFEPADELKDSINRYRFLLDDAQFSCHRSPHSLDLKNGNRGFNNLHPMNTIPFAWKNPREIT